MEEQDNRQLGLGDLAPVPPGSHIAYFYESREDLLQAVIPFLKAGLEAGECCLWVPTPALTVDQAREALAQAIPGLAQFLDSGQLSILSHTEVYTRGGGFDPERVMHGWLEREAEAMSRGYRGLRISGGTGWLEKGDWGSWTSYERAVDEVLDRHRIMALCTYDPGRWSPDEIAQAVNSHCCTLVRKAGGWQLTQPLPSTRKARELERAVQRLSVLYGLTSVCTETLEPRPLLEHGLREILKLPGLEARGAIFLMHNPGTGLSLAAHHGLTPEFAEAESQVPIGECLCGLSAQRGRLIVSASSKEDDRHTRMRHQPDHAHIILPLMRGHNVLGVLCLYPVPPGLEDLDIELLQSAAQELSVGLERAQLFERMSELSITDDLTGLYNRRHFHEALETEIQRTQRYGRSFSLVMLDLDGFKEYNDKFGHASGDVVLKSFAQALRSALRKSDMAFRYGGDELTIILPATDADRAGKIIRRVRSRWLGAPEAQYPAPETPLGFSAGIAQFPENAETVDGLIFLTDIALYQSKREGGSSAMLASDLRTLLPEVLGWATLEQVYALAITVDGRDPHTPGHSKRVATASEMVGKAIGVSQKELADLHVASLLHDIGKVSIADSILTKPGELTGDEWELLRSHSAEGARIVGHVTGLAVLAPMILHHHERYDGTGYPDGLKGQDIPLGARIIGVADAYDTMTTPRPYRYVMSQDEALGELRRCSGAQFDPEFIEAFCRAIGEAASQE